MEAFNFFAWMLMSATGLVLMLIPLFVPWGDGAEVLKHGQILRVLVWLLVNVRLAVYALCGR